jgi:hypothetical protein
MAGEKKGVTEILNPPYLIVSKHGRGVIRGGFIEGNTHKEDRMRRRFWLKTYLGR